MVVSVVHGPELKVGMNYLMRGGETGGGFGVCGFSVQAGGSPDSNEPPNSAGRQAGCRSGSTFFLDPLSYRVPVLFAGNYTHSAVGHIEVETLNATKEELQAVSSAEAGAAAVIRDWLGGQGSAEVFQLPQSSAAPFESGRYLFMPFNAGLSKDPLEVRLAHAMAHAALYSARPWIYEGVANFAQALMIEQQSGREAAIAYMKQQLPAMVQEEKENQAGLSSQQGLKPQSLKSSNGTPEGSPIQRSAEAGVESNAGTSLIAARDELLYRSKAMYVWWMLRDMLGDAVIKGALAKYKPDDDKDSGYMQRLLEQEAQTRRVFPKIQLEQFFDDWVYRDRGLPDFSVKSTFTRKLLSSPSDEHYMATIVVANSANAGAEVAVTVSAGERERVTKKLAVPARGEASVRVPTVNVPTSVTLNDGSVPESDMSNNSATIAVPSE
jgi:hypothetical protein